MNTDISDFDSRSTIMCSKEVSAEEITLDTPNLKPRKIFHIVKFDEKEDLAESELYSNCSPMPSEELLCNEALEFLESNSENVSFYNATLTYTKSINTDRESSFCSQLTSNLIINTLPQSHDTSFSSDIRLSINRKSIRSNTLNSYDFLKTPTLAIDYLKKNSIKTYETTESEIDYFRDVKGFECKKIEEKQTDSDDLLYTGKNLEPIWEHPGDEKKCTWCKIC